MALTNGSVAFVVFPDPTAQWNLKIGARPHNWRELMTKWWAQAIASDLVGQMRWVVVEPLDTGEWLFTVKAEDIDQLPRIPSPGLRWANPPAEVVAPPVQLQAPAPVAQPASVNGSAFKFPGKLKAVANG